MNLSAADAFLLMIMGNESQLGRPSLVVFQYQYQDAAWRLASQERDERKTKLGWRASRADEIKRPEWASWNVKSSLHDEEKKKLTFYYSTFSFLVVESFVDSRSKLSERAWQDVVREISLLKAHRLSKKSFEKKESEWIASAYWKMSQLIDKWGDDLATYRKADPIWKSVLRRMRQF